MELNWIYDMNVLEPKTLCLFWCNDHLYVRSINVDQLELPGRGLAVTLVQKSSIINAIFRKRDAKYSNKLCSKGKKDYADIANNGRGIFLDSCSITDKS